MSEDCRNGPDEFASINTVAMVAGNCPEYLLSAGTSIAVPEIPGADDHTGAAGIALYQPMTAELMHNLIRQSAGKIQSWPVFKSPLPVCTCAMAVAPLWSGLNPVNQSTQCKAREFESISRSPVSSLI